jgi:hypothetical protein
MASLAFCLIDDDVHIALPREFTELTNKFVLVRQGGTLLCSRVFLVLFRTNVGPIKEVVN